SRREGWHSLRLFRSRDRRGRCAHPPRRRSGDGLDPHRRGNRTGGDGVRIVAADISGSARRGEARIRSSGKTADSGNRGRSFEAAVGGDQIECLAPSEKGLGASHRDRRRRNLNSLTRCGDRAGKRCIKVAEKGKESDGSKPTETTTIDL